MLNDNLAANFAQIAVPNVQKFFAMNLSRMYAIPAMNKLEHTDIYANICAEYIVVAVTHTETPNQSRYILNSIMNLRRVFPSLDLD